MGISPPIVPHLFSFPWVSALGPVSLKKAEASYLLPYPFPNITVSGCLVASPPVAKLARATLLGLAALSLWCMPGNCSKNWIPCASPAGCCVESPDECYWLSCSSLMLYFPLFATLQCSLRAWAVLPRAPALSSSISQCLLGPKAQAFRWGAQEVNAVPGQEMKE